MWKIELTEKQMSLIAEYINMDLKVNGAASLQRSVDMTNLLNSATQIQQSKEEKKEGETKGHTTKST